MRCVPISALVLLLAMPVAAQDPPTSATPAPANDGWRVRWDGHPAIDWPGVLHVEFHARLQGDGRASEAAIERRDDDGFDVGRRRIGIEGRLGRHVEFQVERDLEATNPWRDVWINYRPVRAAQIQAGQFKLPFGLEETTGGGSLDFIHRSLISTRLAPGRDRGLMLHGRVAGRRLGYEVGVFAHDGDHARPNGGRRVFGDRTIAGRVTAEPFGRSKAWWSDLHLGTAFTTSALPEGFPAIRGRSLLGVPFFNSDLWVEGRRERTGLEARWRPGPLSISSEFIRVADDRRAQSMSGTDLTPFVARGWYASGAWVVLGARRVARAAVPHRPLFGGGFGSVQLTGRVERFSLGGATGTDAPSASPRASAIAGNGEHAVTLGAIWHPNRWISIHGNLVREAIGEAGRDSYPRLRFWSRLVRVQVEI